MSIDIVHGSPQTVWVDCVPATTYYVGGLVTVDTSGPEEGVIMLPDAAGVANVTNHDVVSGVILGTNADTPVWDTTYNTESIVSPAAADLHDGATATYRGVEGPLPGNEQLPRLLIGIITPSTVLRAPLRLSAIGTPPTEVTVTTGGATGVSCTIPTPGFTGTADNMQTLYFRTGNNAGVYRTTDAASATAQTWDVATRNDVAVGDTCVMAPVRPFGLSTVMFDDVSSTFIDTADAPVLAGTARWGIFVHRLDLSVAGNEYVEFRFDPMHFAGWITSA